MTTVETWTLVISIASILIAIITFIISTIFSKKISDENLNLQKTPFINAELIWGKKITGQFVKKEYDIDSFNVFESEYTPNMKEVIIIDNEKMIQTDCLLLSFTNLGNGICSNVAIESLSYEKGDKKIIVIHNINFYPVIDKEKTVNRYLIKKIDDQNLGKVKLVLSYFDITRKQYYQEYVFADSDEKTGSMEAIKLGFPTEAKK